MKWVWRPEERGDWSEVTQLDVGRGRPRGQVSKTQHLWGNKNVHHNFFSELLISYIFQIKKPKIKSQLKSQGYQLVCWLGCKRSDFTILPEMNMINWHFSKEGALAFDPGQTPATHGYILHWFGEHMLWGSERMNLTSLYLHSMTRWSQPGFVHLL